MVRATYSPEREREHFDRLSAETGEIWWGSATPAGLERLRRRARIVFSRASTDPDARILDMGCGTGALTKELLAYRPTLRLTGCDISPNTVAICKDRYAAYTGVAFDVADITALPYSDGIFDAVVGNSILHHIPHEKALREGFRVLKPGGALVFFEPNMLNPHVALQKKVKWIGRLLQDSDDETAFFRWPLAAVLGRIGFTDVSVQPFDFLHPVTPKPFIGPVKALEWVMERTPVLKEISGSLRIIAKKP